MEVARAAGRAGPAREHDAPSACYRRGRCLRGLTSGALSGLYPGRRVVPASGLPVVRWAAGVLVWLPASCPGGGPVLEDLRAQAAVHAVRGEPCAAAGVHAGLAAGRGRDGRRGDRAGHRRRMRGAPGGGPGGGSVYDRARLVRRFRVRGLELGTGFAALAVELGGEAIRPAAEPGRFALAAVGAAFAAAAGLPGWLGLGAWRFASSVSGGRLIAANTISGSGRSGYRLLPRSSGGGPVRADGPLLRVRSCPLVPVLLGGRGGLGPGDPDRGPGLLPVSPCSQPQPPPAARPASARSPPRSAVAHCRGQGPRLPRGP